MLLYIALCDIFLELKAMGETIESDYIQIREASINLHFRQDKIPEEGMNLKTRPDTFDFESTMKGLFYRIWTKFLALW